MVRVSDGFLRVLVVSINVRFSQRTRYKSVTRFGSCRLIVKCQQHSIVAGENIDDPHTRALKSIIQLVGVEI